MILPDYEGNSIVNLMSSIGLAMGDKPLYKHLKCISPEELDRKNIVLLVIDGLGYEYVINNGLGSFIFSNIRSSITSMFPSTTAACITTFATGVAPQQHGMTGWFMYFKELGAVAASLPLRLRGSEQSLIHTDVKRIWDQNPFSEKLSAKCYAIKHKKISKSDFTKVMTKDSKVLAFTSLDGMFRRIHEALAERSPQRKFIYSYWSDFDSAFHKYGFSRNVLKRQFNRLDKNVKKLASSLRDTTLIVTADHGLIDTPDQNWVSMKDHPKLQKMLRIPLCGEPRVAYCYIKPGMEKNFENYIDWNLSKYCSLFKSQELVKRNYFGLYKPHPQLSERIGDYIIIMKQKYVIRDFLLGEKKDFLKGNHGGLSSEEMMVPLLVFRS